jgi:hypothetical protein
MPSPGSSLARHTPTAFSDDEIRARARREAAKAWRAPTPILVVRLDDERLSWPERELLRQLGDKLNGEKLKGEAGR